MTQLTIIPKVADKTARFKGTIAAGEHVAVTIKGGAEWIGTDSGANLTLRVLDLVTGRTLAVFPRPEEVLEENEEADEWAVSEEDAGDLTCTLNLNTLRMVAAARHMLRVPVMFVLGDTDDPRTLYFRDRYEVEYWPERIGDTVPYDLDKWPKQIDEWADQIVEWAARLDNLALDAERTPASGGNTGYVTITLNDGTLDTDKTVVVYDGENGEVTTAQMEAYAAPIAHVSDTDLHLQSGERAAWTAKQDAISDLSTIRSGASAGATAYQLPQTGIPKTDLASAVQTSLGKADSALQSHQSLAAYVNGGTYDSTNKKILLQHDSSTIAEIDAAAFIKDGMVDSVEITGGNLVISFNTDAGVEDIEIPLTSIFNPANYYDKTAADGRYVQKETGKGLVAVDATLTTQGAAADAKAVGDALAGKVDGDAIYPEWMTDPPNPYTGRAIVSHNGYLYQLGEEYAGTDSEPGVSEEWGAVRLESLKQDALSASQLANIAAVPNKANTTDLPYRLVTLTTPTVWLFSGSGVQSGHAYSIIETNMVVYWNYVLMDNGTQVSSADIGEKQTTVDFSASGDPQVDITATLSGYALLDRAGNRVVVTGDTTLTLPAAVSGYLRDFLVRLEISGSTVPTITFAAPTGETLTYETDGDAFPVPDEAGSWSYSFTENCVAHKFAVSLKKVNEVAQGGS